jgi:hypothetical protein
MKGYLRHATFCGIGRRAESVTRGGNLSVGSSKYPFEQKIEN